MKPWSIYATSPSLFWADAREELDYTTILGEVAAKRLELIAGDLAGDKGGAEVIFEQLRLLEGVVKLTAENVGSAQGFVEKEAVRLAVYRNAFPAGDLAEHVRLGIVLCDRRYVLDSEIAQFVEEAWPYLLGWRGPQSVEAAAGELFWRYRAENSPPNIAADFWGDSRFRLEEILARYPKCEIVSTDRPSYIEYRHIERHT